jgi:hypothetical protein
MLTPARRSILLLPVVFSILAACAAPGDLPDGSGAGASVLATEVTPSPTIVWFPPTSTWTPFPTPLITPTIESRPGLGDQTFSDNFSDPKDWPGSKPASEGSNSIIVNGNLLTLAVNQPPAVLSSLRNDLQLTGFYARVNISVNRCADNDTYGMLFRAAGSQNAYRYVLACNGKLRAERLQAGRVVIMQDWLASGDVPSGAPAQVQLGVWAAGVELRFFLNGRFQFRVIDPVFHNGTLGLFINAGSPVGMNIGFSDLAVYAVSYVSPTPTATPRKTPTPSRTPKQ